MFGKERPGVRTLDEVDGCSACAVVLGSVLLWDEFIDSKYIELFIIVLPYGVNVFSACFKVSEKVLPCNENCRSRSTEVLRGEGPYAEKGSSGCAELFETISPYDVNSCSMSGEVLGIGCPSRHHPGVSIAIISRQMSESLQI
jgi:hypothetical protein